jgi:uncharacterized protein (TIGR00369 family)
MSKQAHDDCWPYVEQFTLAHSHESQDQSNWPTVLQAMGLRLEKVAKDYSRVSISPPAELVQPRSMLQGGLVATLVDTAARMSLRTTLKPEHDAVTIHLDTKYFRPVYGERVVAESSVVRRGRTLAHIDVAVLDDNGTLVARGWCVFKLTSRVEVDSHYPKSAATMSEPPEQGCAALEARAGI